MKSLSLLDPLRIVMQEIIVAIIFISAVIFLGYKFIPGLNNSKKNQSGCSNCKIASDESMKKQ